MTEMSSDGGESDNLFSSENNDELSSERESADSSTRGLSQKGRARAPVREKVAPSPDADAWRLEPHICRSCFSRLVSREVDQHRVLDAPQPTGRLYQCTNCGLEAPGPGAEVLCCCGIQIRRPTKTHKSGHHLVDAGIRCAPNPEPRPDFPSLYIATEPQS